jgi:hypothetical protein
MAISNYKFPATPAFHNPQEGNIDRQQRNHSSRPVQGRLSTSSKQKHSNFRKFITVTDQAGTALTRPRNLENYRVDRRSHRRRSMQ